MTRIVAVGDNVVDCYHALDQMFPGGNCLNLSLFARRFGATTSYLGAIGQDAAGDAIQKALAETHEGLRQGKLFKYATAVDVWHCPGDRRQRLKIGRGWAFDSYGGAGGLDGEDEPSSIKKYNQILYTSRNYVFVEEADDRGWNLGSWLIDPDPKGLTWVDAVAIWHNRKSTLSFADGHALTHKWLGDTVLRASEVTPGVAKFGQTAKSPADKQDVWYMKYGYTHNKQAEFEKKWEGIPFRP